jgi:hypothetical protein
MWVMEKSDVNATETGYQRATFPVILETGWNCRFILAGDGRRF